MDLILYVRYYVQVQNATNANIKEKHEADLKKEIKKLQVCHCGLFSCQLMCFFLFMV